jgi:hypothetical protein
MPAIEYMSPIATFEHRMIERKKLWLTSRS